MPTNQKTNFLNRLIHGERGLFLLIMILALIIILCFWVYDAHRFGYAWETEGKFYLYGVIFLLLVITGTSLHYLLKDYPRDKKEGGIYGN